MSIVNIMIAVNVKSITVQPTPVLGPTTPLQIVNKYLPVIDTPNSIAIVNNLGIATVNEEITEWNKVPTRCKSGDSLAWYTYPVNLHDNVNIFNIAGRATIDSGGGSVFQKIKSHPLDHGRVYFSCSINYGAPLGVFDYSIQIEIYVHQEMKKILRTFSSSVEIYE
jgi:hypothetical protein